MKKFFGAIALCSAVLAVCSFVVVREAGAVQVRGDVVSELLSLPAPPAPNPLESAVTRRADDDPFFSRDAPPPDNAPIEDILDYWARQSYGDLADNNMPSPLVLDRIAAAMESDPSRISSFLHYLKDSQRGIAAVRSAYNRAVAEGEARSNANVGANAFYYDDEEYYDESEYGGADGLKRWLLLNDPLFSAELEPLAAEVKDTDNGYIQNDDEFLALARNDWGRARPMVDKMYADAGQPASKALATWALYKKALDDGSISDAEKYREELKTTVENRQLSVGVRDLALDALSLNGEWSGRDDWYFSLMKDPTMLEFGGYTGLTTLIINSKTGKYKAKMIKLLESSDPTVRAAAARNLSIEVEKGDVDAIKALLPWLEDPTWIKDVGDGRGALIRELSQVKVPESVPGLIAVLNERVEMRRSLPGVGYSANANVAVNANATSSYSDWIANSVPYNSGNTIYNGPINTGEPVYSYPYRYSALSALKTQASPIAIPALRRLYNEMSKEEAESYYTGKIVEALFTSGAFSVAERVAALEWYARRMGDLAQKMEAARASSGSVNVVYEVLAQLESWTPSDKYQQTIAELTTQSTDPPDELVAATIQRIKALEPRDPQIAQTLRDMVSAWNTRAANAMMLADMKDGKASSATIVNLLIRRKQIRETQANDVYGARGGVPTAAGFATCILEDTLSYSAIMNDPNVLVRSAFLACARLVRIPLSPDDVARELSSPDKRLALAAKLYLLSEDSARSRQILYASFPNQAIIAGSFAYFTGAAERSNAIGESPSELFASVDPRFSGGLSGPAYYSDISDLQSAEKRFQEEILGDESILGLYVYGRNVVRIYADRVTYDQEDDDARSYRRVLLPQEFDRLKRILADRRVGELKAFVSCIDHCRASELLMLGRAGGSRIFAAATKMPELFEQLDEFFADIGEQKGALHYTASDKVPGLQIVFADPRLSVETVWADGGDVRFFATDVAERAAAQEELEDRIAEFYEQNTGADGSRDYSVPGRLREESAYKGRAWYALSAERIDRSSAPAGIELPPRSSAAELETFSDGWSLRGGGAELQHDGEALYKVTGTNRVKIADGNFFAAAISPDGRWVLGRTYNDDTDETVLLRIDAATRRSYPVAEGNLSWVIPLGWIPGANKFLVSFGNYGSRDVTSATRLRFVDPVTGELTPVYGEVVPFAQQTFRLLQPASGGGLWAAVPDTEKDQTNVGIIELPSLKFTQRVSIPNTGFSSMQMWVDEKESVLYFVYSGHLLRMPMGK